MRRLGIVLLSTSALAAVVATPAIAAPPVPYTWTGFYFGGNLGYSWGHAKVDGSTPGITADTNCCGVVDIPGADVSDKLKLNGWTGGGQIGYNWQTAPNWLWGLEADIQGTGEKGNGKARSDIDTFFPGDLEGCCDVFGETNTRYEAKIKWFGTVRARTGFIANNLLFYATGGLAYGKVSLDGKTSTSVDFMDGGRNGTLIESASGGDSFSASKVKVGYTVGAGVEGQLWDPRWTWKAEYLFVNLGTLKVDVGGESDALRAKFTDNVVRFGLNFRP